MTSQWREVAVDWRAQAEHFLKHETQFHLGVLPTEQSHPATRGLSDVLQRDVAAGVRMLQAVDADVAECADAVFEGEPFAELASSLAILAESVVGVAFLAAFDAELGHS